MKRIINILVCAVTLISTLSCFNKEIMEAVVMNDEIVLVFSSLGTKAADTEVESRLNTVDVMFFNNENGSPTTLKHHERIVVGGSAESRLAAKRSDFDAGVSYYVQVIANSTLDKNIFSEISDYNDLENLRQEDENIHITGLDLEVAPKYFLMDGVAYVGNTKPSVPESVIINNGVASDHTELKVALDRAAAKVEVIINAGNRSGEFDLNFKDGLSGSSGASYYVRNLPYETYVLDSEPSSNTRLQTTSKTNNDYFQWKPESSPKKVTLVTYAYAHDWKGESILEKEPCVVVNLPFVYSDLAAGTNHEHPNSWYKIPMSADGKFDRNKYYRVEVTINRAGATTMLDPVEMEGINYSVSEWNQVDINVGSGERPNYLYVNEDEVVMSNIDSDETTLEFASSSDVSVSIDKIWYYDKFGNEINITGSSSGISIVPDSGLAGNIKIYSPKPANNTIRYITFTVSNTSGDKHEVSVTQYPLEYITNAVSWYSYRSDFLSNSGDPTGTATGKHYENRDKYTRFGATHENGISGYSNTGFFVSKYVASTYTSGSNKGLSDVDSYTANSTGNFNDPYNARIYHIRIMASSGQYAIGKPKITDGVTDPGIDNSKLVSPSFMIASRLGTLTTDRVDVELDLSGVPARPNQPNPGDYGALWMFTWYWPAGSDEAGYQAALAAYEAENKIYQEAVEQANIQAYLKVYAEHCKQYVEVYDPDNNPSTDNSIHYNDWRLPTQAELEIIYKFQGKKGDTSVEAIDYLLNAEAYYSAKGPVINPNKDMNGHSVRCIRDAY